MRANSLNPHYTNDNIILEATSKYFINDEFKNKYEYDVFFSVDSIDIGKAICYFGEEHLKNIHITETDWFLYPIEDNLLNNYSHYHNEYLLNNDFKNCDNHIQALYQYYRMYHSYNLLENHKQKNNIEYDYLVRIRPDIRLMQDIMPLFHILETTNKKIIMEHEQLCILKYDLRDMFKLINYYGFFKTQINENIFKHFIKQPSDMLIDEICRFCPEKQFIEYLYYIIKNKNLIFKEVFTGITYPSYNLLYRGNGIYGYVNYDSQLDWIPYNNINYIQKL